MFSLGVKVFLLYTQYHIPVPVLFQALVTIWYFIKAIKIKEVAILMGP